MAEYQITEWRGIPSLVVARDGDETAKVQLPVRFQEAIDEAAMRMGDIDADAYLAGWSKSAWTAIEGSPQQVVERVAAEIESRLDDRALTALLDTLNGA